MAQIVKLRRSSVSGQKPTNSNLQLGELALNTTDGKVYMAKSGSLGPSVEEIISTNTVNTGSINLVGDISASLFTGSFKGDGSGLYNIPLSGVTNLVIVSGSIDSRLDTLETYSSSQLVPSSSMSFRTLQTDVYCKNVSGVQINKGTVVRIVGSVGDNPLIAPADLLTEGQSANTLGIATQDIPNDSFGLIITEGILTGVNTNGMTAGALLYLGANGIFTTTPPVAPNHGVRLGEVLRVQQNQGSIYVRIDNGSELNEAHDVIYSSIGHGDLLVRSGSVWKNGKSLEGNYTVTGSLTVTQNLTVLGSSSLVYVTSSNLAVSASFISVNVFEPAERFGGLKVYDSGSSNATASLAWDSQNNHWVYQNASGSQYSGGMLLSGPRNSGSLGDEVGLISGRIAKSVGGDHLDNSIISETGTTINIDGNLVANSITGSFDFFGLVNRPTLVSGSEQIIISGTTGYSTFSGSISSSIGELSSSIATTTNDLDGRLDSIEGVTGSYATTGSNLFKGTQTISGSVIIGTGSLDLISPEVLHVENSGSYNIARFDGYDYNYVQVNLQNHHSGSSASTDFVLTADNGTETTHYVDLGINSSTYNAGYVGNANDAYLLNSGNDLYVGTIGNIYHPSNLNLFAQNSWENPQVVISGSKQISFNTGSVSNGYQYEFSGSIKADHNLNVVGSVTSSFGVDSPTITNNGHTWEFLSAGQMRPAGTIMGSSYDSNQVDVQNLGPLLLKGMAYGAQVITSPDNGSTSYTWEFGTDGKLSIPGDVNINGTVTAKELHINLITSSVLYESGSTKFGDTSDDTHNFTGSVYISGGINVGSITGSIDFNNLTNTPTLVSGSSQISYTGITNVPSGIVSGSSQISFNGITDVPTLVSGSSQISYTGIIDTPSGIVSGSSQISYTGITDTPSGIVSSSQQVIDLGFVTTGSFESFTGSYVSDSGSFDTRIDNIFGSLTGLTETYNFHTSSFTSFSSSIESHTSSINNFTSSVVLSSQTSSMTVLSSSYALTASYALNGGGGGTEGRTAKLNQTVASSTWTFNHNLGEKHPAIEIFNEDDYVVVPTNILAVSDNTLTITFSSPVSGTATATVGGGIPFISASYDGRVLAVNDGGPTWKEGIISGSLQIEEFGYSTTGSNSFVGEQIVTGSLTIRNAKIDATCVTVSTGTTIFDLSSFDGATFDYVVKNGGNMRAGTIVSVWSGAVSSYNETSTIDLGNTSAITFEVSGDGKLNTVISSGTWIVEVLYRALGCTS